MRISIRRIRLALLALLFLIFGVQFLYFFSRIKSTGTDPGRDFDLVLTYSDLTSMRPALDLALSQHKPLYVSQAPWEANPFSHLAIADLALVHLDPNATTTDQNARRAAAFIQQGGYHKVVLDVDWFHVPRALFLTRLYLMGSRVEVMACDKTTLPPQWWNQRWFHIELYKFWGSIVRVILAFLGWETGPSGPHTWT
jgi:hypothetical protein